MLLALSVAEAVWTVYMLRYFTTTVNLSVQKWDGYFLHPTSKSLHPRNMVCPFGHDAALLIAAILVLRHWLPRSSAWCLTLALVVVVSTLSLAMNVNVFVYLVPVLLVETYRLSSGRILHFEDLCPVK